MNEARRTGNRYEYQQKRREAENVGNALERDQGQIEHEQHELRQQQHTFRRYPHNWD
jgi:hypothetical protein